MFPKIFACGAAGKVILHILRKCYKLALLKKKSER